MTNSVWATLGAALVVGMAACGDDPVSTEYGVVKVQAITTGGEFDATGYAVLIDGDSANYVDVNAPWLVSLPVGPHLVGLDGVAPNCVGPDEAQEVTVVARSITEAVFEVECVASADLAGIRILFAGPTGLVSMNADGSDRQTVVSGRLNHDPALSPDGTRLAFIRMSDGGTENELWVADADGTHAERLIRGSVWVPRWSPDGTLLAYGTYSANLDGSIRVRGLDGSDALVALTGNGLDGDEAWPTFSPDGSQIAFSFYGSIWVAPVDGGAASTLVGGYYPAWAPDGRVAYVAGPFDDLNIKSVQPDGTSLTTILDAPLTLPIHLRDWSGDGTLLLYSGRNLSNGTDVFLVRTTDGSLVRLTGDGDSRDPVFWPSEG